MPWVRAQSIALIPQGGWIVQEAAPSKTTVVYARNRREVFRVSGEEAYIYYFKPQSVAVFTQDGHHEGLVNLATGKVLIRPKDVDLRRGFLTALWVLGTTAKVMRLQNGAIWT